MKLLILTLGDKQIGIFRSAIDKVCLLPEVIPNSSTPTHPWLLGTVKHKNRQIPLIDLQRKLGGPTTKGECMLVVKVLSCNRPVAFVAILIFSAAMSIVEVSDKVILPATTHETNTFQVYGRLATDNGLVDIVNPSKYLRKGVPGVYSQAVFTSGSLR